MTEEQEYEEYILNAATCEVCGEGFAAVEDAIDAGTDLYVHNNCAKDWHGAWLDGNINPNRR